MIIVYYMILLDAVTLPMVVTIQANYEAHLSDLTHQETLNFINLHHDILLNGMSVDLGGTSVSINGLNFVKFVWVNF